MKLPDLSRLLHASTGISSPAMQQMCPSLVPKTSLPRGAVADIVDGAGKVLASNVVRLLAFAFLAAGVAACSQAQVSSALTSPAGQLFCAIQTGGGGALVVALVDGGASALTGPAGAVAGPVAVIATGALKKDVDTDCAQAAANVGASSGVPVAPPPATATAPPLVAVTPAHSAAFYDAGGAVPWLLAGKGDIPKVKARPTQSGRQGAPEKGLV